MTALERITVRLCHFKSTSAFTEATLGHFEWGGHDFTEDARNIKFNMEGSQQVPVLRAELRDQGDDYVARDVNLAERINNRGGHLKFV